MSSYATHMHRVCNNSILQFVDGIRQLFHADVRVHSFGDGCRSVTNQSLYRQMVNANFAHPGCKGMPTIMRTVSVELVKVSI